MVILWLLINHRRDDPYECSKRYFKARVMLFKNADQVISKTLNLIALLHAHLTAPA